MRRILYYGGEIWIVVLTLVFAILALDKANDIVDWVDSFRVLK